MAGFDVAGIDELLDYKLGSYGEDGRVPQPSTGEVRKFRDSVLDVQCRIVGLTPEQAIAAPAEGEQSEFEKRMDAITATERDELADGVLEHVVDVCKGHPSRDELVGMPAMVRNAFVNWLLGVLSPLL